jgi:hypothetical protein
MDHCLDSRIALLRIIRMCFSNLIQVELIVLSILQLAAGPFDLPDMMMTKLLFGALESIDYLSWKVIVQLRRWQCLPHQSCARGVLEYGFVSKFVIEILSIHGNESFIIRSWNGQ